MRKKDTETKNKSNGINDLDDGRVVADMTTLENPSFFSLRMLSKLRKGQADKKNKGEDADGVSLDREERRAAIGGTLGAALLIASVYAVAFGLVILCMYLLFKLK